MSQSLVTYFPRSQGRSWFQIPFPASRQHVAGSVLDLLDGVLSRKAIDGIMGKVTTLVNCSPNSLADCCAKAFLWMVKHSPSCKGSVLPPCHNVDVALLPARHTLGSILVANDNHPIVENFIFLV